MLLPITAQIKILTLLSIEILLISDIKHAYLLCETIYVNVTNVLHALNGVASPKLQQS